MGKENAVPPGERFEILKEIEANNSDVDAARQKGDQQQLLSDLEKGLYLSRRLYPEASEEVADSCRRLCEACNVVGQALLQREHLKGAHELLKRAEEVAERNPRDKAITWNNLACYYRRVGKLRVAVTLLERALEIEEYTSPDEATQTHLNLCATLSQLNRHTEALAHAKSAMIRQYEILSPMMLDARFSKRPLDEEQSEQVLVLCIAYHNSAVENEYLKNYEAAMRAYMEGYDWATKFLSPDHQLIEIMKSSIDAMKGNLKPGSLALGRAEEILVGKRRQDNIALENGKENIPIENGKVSDDAQLGNLTTLEDKGKSDDQAAPKEKPSEPPLFGSSTKEKELEPPLFGSSTKEKTPEPLSFNSPMKEKALEPPVFGSSTKENTLEPPLFGSKNEKTLEPPLFGSSKKAKAPEPPLFGSSKKKFGVQEPSNRSADEDETVYTT